MTSTRVKPRNRSGRGAAGQCVAAAVYRKLVGWAIITFPFRSFSSPSSLRTVATPVVISSTMPRCSLRSDIRITSQFITGAVRIKTAPPRHQGVPRHVDIEHLHPVPWPIRADWASPPAMRCPPPSTSQNPVARTELDLRGPVLQNCPLARRLADVHHVTHGLAKTFLVQHPGERWHPGRHDDPHDRHHHHDLDEGERPRDGRGARPRKFSDWRPGFHRPPPLPPSLMLEISLNIGSSTLINRKPTTTAITMISTGSIRLVMTRSEICNSPS